MIPQSSARRIVLSATMNHFTPGPLPREAAERETRFLRRAENAHTEQIATQLQTIKKAGFEKSSPRGRGHR